MTENLKHLFLLFPVVGVGLFIGGVLYRKQLKAKVANFERIPGTVIDNIAGIAGGFDTTPTYSPVVEYFVKGHRFSVRSDTGYGRRKEKGTSMTVIYNPANPAIAYIGEDYYTFPNLLLAIGGVFVLLGSLIAWHMFR